ncbi:MAG: hypothetical protein K0U61_02610 [Alphaproteobacteria bacterium]|nr:hypothetical protein [Alphaproteobacteria bacterium]
MTIEKAFELALGSIVEDCPEFPRDECEHVADRVIEILHINDVDLLDGDLSDMKIGDQRAVTGPPC